VSDATEESGRRDTILIGGSAGAIEAVQQILKPLSSDFPGSLFVVVHTTSEGPGLLARAGGMSAVFPKNGESIRSGCIYVAPPDHHLMLGADDSIVVAPRPAGKPAPARYRSAVSQCRRAGVRTTINRRDIERLSR
jgi:chemotaxis response regulator CheB